MPLFTSAGTRPWRTTFSAARVSGPSPLQGRLEIRSLHWRTVGIEARETTSGCTDRAVERSAARPGVPGKKVLDGTTLSWAETPTSVVGNRQQPSLGDILGQLEQFCDLVLEA